MRHRGHRHPRGGDRGSAGALAADSHDVVRVHPRRVAAGDRERGRRRQPALARHRRVLRNAVRDHDRHLLHPALLRHHPRTGRAAAARAVRPGRASRCRRRPRRRHNDPSSLEAGPGLAGGRLRRRARATIRRRWFRPRRRSAPRLARATRRRSSSTRSPRRRDSDTVGGHRPKPAARVAAAGFAARPRVGDIFRDTTLVGLVESRAGAEPRSADRRSAGSASSGPMSASLEAPLFPEHQRQRQREHQPGCDRVVPANASSTRWRVTGDVAWELDFWGRIRRGHRGRQRRSRPPARRASARWCSRW